MAPDAIETERLRGERTENAHRAFLRALFGEPEVAASLWPGDLGGPRTAEQADAILTGSLAHWERHRFGPWVFHDARTSTPVGLGGLHVTTVDGREEVEILYTIRSDRWGDGYATEIAGAALDSARSHSGIDTVVAFTLPTNHASQRVMEKVGLQYEREIVHAGLVHVLYRADV